MRISDWSSDVCSSDLNAALDLGGGSRIGFGVLGARQFCDDGVEHLLVADQGGQHDRVLPANAHVGAGEVPQHIDLGAADGKRLDRKSTRLNSSHSCASRMPSSALNKNNTYTHI